MLRLKPVTAFEITTVAPGSTPPVASLTTPCTVPAPPSPWANTVVAQTGHARADSSASARIIDFMGLLEAAHKLRPASHRNNAETR